MGDISERAEAVLAAADVIACEDTRVSGKLLARLGIQRPLIAYHDHNAEAARPAILARLAAGETVALISDAGTPSISDPGYKLVRACIEGGYAVSAVPGPNAALMALTLSGLPTDRFLFEGFLPPKTAGRRDVLTRLSRIPATLLFQEGAARLPESLADMAAVLGPREAAVARELTKLYEEVRRGPLDRLAAHYAEAGPPKGEIVIVVAPPSPEAAAPPETMEAMLADALKSMSLRDAADAVARASGLPRREVYARALELAKK